MSTIYFLPRVPVRSSNLRSIGYDAATGMLDVEFHNRAVYRHYQVPLDRAIGLYRATSKGRYYRQHLCSRYGYRRIL